MQPRVSEDETSERRDMATKSPPTNAKGFALTPSPRAHPGSNADRSPPVEAAVPVAAPVAAVARGPVRVRSPSPSTSDSSDYEMPEEQDQAAAAGDDVKHDDEEVGLHRPPPQQQRSNTFDSDSDSSEDETLSGKERAAIRLRKIREKQLRRDGGGGAARGGGGANFPHDAHAATQLSKFDSHEFEAPEEKPPARVVRGAPSARLVMDM